jgi:cellulose synthase/poly-beta-1,6-N-acetylglucosamine synthase-like glycosyltransferase
MISLIHPSRGRPKQSYENMKLWVDRADSKDFEIILSLDDNDPSLQDYINTYQRLNFAFSSLILPNKSSVEAINNAAKIAQGNIFIVVADDQRCPINWFRRIIKYTQGHEDFVLKVKDGFQDRIITQPILDRAYYNRDKYIYHPRFQHLFCDTFFTDVAVKRKRVISKNITFPHLQYSILNTEPDAIYKKNNQTYESGKKTYLELRRTI